MNERVLAIIPARSGSKGLPDKNVKELHDKPLLAWSIIQAQASEHVDDVMVNTDSKRYAAVSREYGAEVPFIRPDRLARDKTAIDDVIIHHLDWLENRGETYDLITLVEPTSPLRKKKDIDAPLERLVDRSETADSIVSVRLLREEGHPYLVKEIVNEKLKPYYETNEEIYQRQQLPDLFQLEGTIYASTVDSYRDQRDFVQEQTLPYQVDRWQAPEVDDIYDFICIERILEHVKDQVVGYNIDSP
jgi:CMP-N-acetylneuraminic acid synthetase